MVGLAIGMLATVVIIQVISVFEAQRRTTTGTADAQTNGGIALYNITRELQLAGYPLVPMENSPLKCTTLNINGTADATFPNRLSPVAISDGVATAGVSASDAITIRYGDSPQGGVPTQISATAPTAPSNVNLLTSFGCNAGDVSLIANGTTCNMSTVSAVVTPAPVSLPQGMTLANPSGVIAGANLSCLGKWSEVTYAVNQATGNLERTVVENFAAPVTTPVVVGIVNLQAQYGISAAGLANTDSNFNQVVQWVDASGGTWGGALTADNRNRIKAIRIAVVARNAKMEPSAVTTACSSTTVATPTGLCAWDATSALPTPPLVSPFVASPAPAIDLSPGDANWARYRYRVFETIIPLRNIVWSKDTL